MARKMRIPLWERIYRPALAHRYEVITYGLLVFSRIQYQTPKLRCQVWARDSHETFCLSSPPASPERLATRLPAPEAQLMAGRRKVKKQQKNPNNPVEKINVLSWNLRAQNDINSMTLHMDGSI
jgi:hypothetical protein